MTDSIPTPPTPTPKVKRTKSPQDLKVLEFNTKAQEYITVCRDDLELRPLLTPLGFDDAKFTALIALQTADQTAIDTRLATQGAVMDASSAHQATWAQSNTDATHFRKTVNAAFPKGDAAHAALNATGTLPRDVQTFVTFMRAGYDAALNNTTYLATLVASGLPEAEITAARTRLDDVPTTHEALTEAEGADASATRDSKLTDTALRQEIRKLKVAVEGVTAGRPDLRRRLPNI